MAKIFKKDVEVKEVKPLSKRVVLVNKRKVHISRDRSELSKYIAEGWEEVK